MILLDISFTDIFNPAFYLEHGGLWLLLFIVFAETGLMIGFFLPGDSLLFIAGVYSNKLINAVIPGGLGSDFYNLLLLIILITSAGIAGNVVGYWFGKKSGTYLFNKKDTLIFKKRYLLEAKDFYDKYGAQTIVIARFLPIIRTFAPIVAGIVNMNKPKFIVYNVIGCLGWVICMTMAGHYLERFFLLQYDYDIKDHLEIIVLGLIIVTSIPFAWKYLKEKCKGKAKP